MEFKSSDRIFVTGQTGSGKSYFVTKAILPRLRCFVFYDYKRDFSNLPYRKVTTLQEVYDEVRNNKSFRLVFQPFDASDDIFDELCRTVYTKGNCTLVIDEVARHSKPAKILFWHDTLMRLGRSRNVGIINTTQRPRDIHNNLLSESQIFFVFQLNLSTDKEKLRGVMGDIALNALDKFQFIYYNNFTQDVKICEPIA